MRPDELGKRFADGDIIFRESEKGEAMYVLQAGRVKLTRRDPGGERVIAVLEPGEIFGEMALFDRKPRSATAVAVGPTRVLTIDRGKLFKSINRDPTLLFKILETLTGRLRRIDKELAAAERFRKAFLDTDLGVEETCRLVLEEAKSLMPSENGSIMLLDEGGNRLSIAAAFGTRIDGRRRLGIGEGIAGRVVESGRAEIVPDTSADPRFLPGKLEVQSLACVPLIYEGSPFGVINVSTGRGRRLTPRKFELLQALGRFASVFIHNALRFSQAQGATEEVFRRASLLDY
jgi:putative methionine-R-sulfoxide reductase with GAF domain